MDVVPDDQAGAAAVGDATIRSRAGTIIAGDAVIRIGNIARRHPIGINESMEEALIAYDRIARGPDIIVPLYDPGVWDRHPGSRIA